MKITILKEARNYISHLPKDHQLRLVNAIFELPAGDVKPIKGEESAFRLRVGKWRVVYQMLDNEIVIRKIGSRGDVYK